MLDDLAEPGHILVGQLGLDQAELAKVATVEKLLTKLRRYVRTGPV